MCLRPPSSGGLQDNSGSSSKEQQLPWKKDNSSADGLNAEQQQLQQVDRCGWSGRSDDSHGVTTRDYSRGPPPRRAVRGVGVGVEE